MIEQTEIFDGVHLTAVTAEKFKSNLLTLTLSAPLRAETASLNALIPRVLRHGTRRFRGFLELNRELDRLYGCEISGSVFKTGDVQCVSLSAEFPDEMFLPEKANITERVIELFGDVLLFPATRGGRFISEYVETEKQKLIEDIRAERDDRQYYSQLMMERCMYKNTPFAESELGTVKSAAAIGVRALTKQYHALLSSCPIELFYCGSERIDRISVLLANALAPVPMKGKRTCAINTPALTASELKRVNIKLDTTEAFLSVGCRIPAVRDESDIAAAALYNAILGGTSRSRLFKKLRDKMGLCYYAESDVDIHMGLLTIIAGSDPAKVGSVADEILEEIENMRENITPDEFNTALRYVANEILLDEDDPWALERFCLNSRILGIDTQPETLAAMVVCTSVSDVRRFARGVTPDTVCIVSGGGA